MFCADQTPSKIVSLGAQSTVWLADPVSRWDYLIFHRVARLIEAPLVLCYVLESEWKRPVGFSCWIIILQMIGNNALHSHFQSRKDSLFQELILLIVLYLFAFHSTLYLVAGFKFLQLYHASLELFRLVTNLEVLGSIPGHKITLCFSACRSTQPVWMSTWNNIMPYDL